MVLKQCHSRLKRFGVKQPDKVRSLVPATISPAVNTSPCVRCIITSPFGNSEQRGRRAGLKTMHLSAVTHMCTRELSSSIKALQYLKPSVPKCEGGRLLFDTHAVVRLFEENGFTTQQAEVMVNVLMRTTNSNMEVIYNDMVTKVQQEIMLQQVMSQIAAVKKDMIILEKSEFSTLLAENEKLKIQLLQLKVQLADVMNKVRSDTIIDMNLEKSRVKELSADLLGFSQTRTKALLKAEYLPRTSKKVEHEKMLLETRTEIMEMTAEQDRHLTQTNMKIDTEVAGLKTMLESHKLDTIKYLAGSVFTCLTVVLGFYRIWM